MYQVISVTLSGGWETATHSLTPPPVRDEGLFLLPMNSGWPLTALASGEGWNDAMPDPGLACKDKQFPCTLLRSLTALQER